MHTVMVSCWFPAPPRKLAEAMPVRYRKPAVRGVAMRRGSCYLGFTMKNRLSTRRLLGVLFLTVATAQVVMGLTVLEARLSGFVALLYWTACLLATLGAILCALVDALHCLAESRRERRHLLEQTLKEIDEERARRSHTAGESLSESH